MAGVKRGGGPGTYVQNGVVCTQGSPFDKAMHSKEGVGGGEYGRNKPPFEQPQSGGADTIPTKFFDGMAATSPRATSSAGASSTIGITKRNVGDRRFKNAK